MFGGVDEEDVACLGDEDGGVLVGYGLDGEILLLLPPLPP